MGGSPAEPARFRELLAAAPPDTSYADVLCGAEGTASPAATGTWALYRAELILTVPAVHEKATVRQAEWRCMVTEFVMMRRGSGPDAHRGSSRADPGEPCAPAEPGADTAEVLRDWEITA